MSDDVERHVSKKELEKLITTGERCDDNAAEARLPFKGEREKLKKKGLNPWAFNVVRQLARAYKSNPAKVAHNLRALDLYVDLLGYKAQLDLEDEIEESGDKPNGASIEKRVAADAAEDAKTGNVVPINEGAKRKRGRPRKQRDDASAKTADKYIGRDGKPVH